MGRTAGELAAALRELAGRLERAGVSGPRMAAEVTDTIELAREAAAVLAVRSSMQQGHHDGCESEGLYHKFHVSRTDGASEPGGKHHGCWYFVLDPTHDQSARIVLGIYAELAGIDGRQPLADDLWRRPELAHNPSPPDPGVTHLAVNRMFIRYATLRAGG